MTQQPPSPPASGGGGPRTLRTRVPWLGDGVGDRFYDVEVVGGRRHLGHDGPRRCEAAFMRLEPRPDSVRQARGFVAGVLAGWEGGPPVDVVLLLTSELVTNAIVHGGPHGPNDVVVIAAERAGDRGIRVEVSDHNVALPVLGDGSLEARSGRGVRLIEGLARSWGVVLDGAGKVVWFEVG